MFFDEGNQLTTKDTKFTNLKLKNKALDAVLENFDIKVN
jgi:hypothetical protein